MNVVQRTDYSPFVVKKLHNKNTAYPSGHNQVLCFETEIFPTMHELSLIQRLIQIFDDLRWQFLDVSVLEFEREYGA
jgi:hypothetical protein